MKNSVSNRYSKEYKVEAVELAISLGNLTKAAKEKGVHQNTLRRWKVDFQKGTLKGDELDEFITSPQTTTTTTTTTSFEQNEINSHEKMKNTNEMAAEEMIASSKETSSQSNQTKNYEELYIKTKEEVERLTRLNDELNNELNEAQASIGELFTKIRKLKKNN